jgi:CubicO group peptidase (beta-lactamase class C family)
VPDADSLRAVRPVREHPGKMWRVRGDVMEPYLPQVPGEVPTHSRQTAALEPLYVQDSSLEIARTRIVADGEIAGRRVVPAGWLHESWTVDPEVREAFAASASGPYLPGGWYRNQFWFMPRAYGDVLVGLGIYGQMLYVDPTTATVAVKLSSWPEAQSPAMLHDTLRAFDAVGGMLAALPPGGPGRSGVPGVAAGLSRRGLGPSAR